MLQNAFLACVTPPHQVRDGDATPNATKSYLSTVILCQNMDTHVEPTEPFSGSLPRLLWVPPPQAHGTLLDCRLRRGGVRDAPWAHLDIQGICRSKCSAPAAHDQCVPRCLTGRRGAAFGVVTKAASAPLSRTHMNT
jgi:hypothetical protein